MAADPPQLHCWRCKGPLDLRLLPFGHRAECPECHAPLHVCRMCRHHAPGRTRHCLEPMAEQVREIDRANYCDWFQPGHAVVAEAQTNLDALASLFGDAAPAPRTTDSARQELDRLFGGGAGNDPAKPRS